MIMKFENYKPLTITLAVTLLLGTTIISGFNTANAENKNHDDKVKLDCLDAASYSSNIGFCNRFGW